MKTALAAIILAAVCLQVIAGDESVTNKNSRTGPFILGAEVSWVPEDEADGAVYYDHGVRKDIFQILKDYKFNYLRLRLFVNPASTNGYARRRAEAFCDLEHVKALAKRAQAAGMGLLLDIHYGDTWTSPGHQEKPVAWKDISFPELTQAVHDFTFQAIKSLKDSGTPVNLVQLGNEISDGLLFPDGRRSNWDNFAALLRAGAAGAKEADPSVKIVLQHHLGRSNERMRPWLDNLIQRGVQFDIIGMSCYAQAQEGDWKNNFDDLAKRYPDKGLLVLEYSARKRYVNDLMFNTPDRKGLGTFIWEPTRHREALFDKDGKNAGGGQASNFTTDEGVNQGARAARTNALSATNLPVGKTQATNVAANTNSPEAIYRSFGTNEAARAEWRKRRFGGRYDVNELMALYPQMAKDYADVAPPQGVLPVTVPATPANTAPVILTPPAPDTPRINGPTIFGVRPGSPFLFTIPATGERPMKFSADHLPRGLKLDAKTGRITGKLKKPGEFNVTLRAKNSLGTAEKPFRIVVGEDIALTPAMGWNSYNCFGVNITQDKALRAARAMIALGLDRHGWTYINMDDGWEARQRGGPYHALQADPQRFTGIKAMVDEIHAMGLKAGLYSTPWTVSYGGRLGGSSENPEGNWDPNADLKAPKNKKIPPYAIGKYSFATNDAQQFAEWGFDYFKYDWGPVEAPETKEMYQALRATGRDIVFSLSNNHVKNLFRNIGEVSKWAQSWRTTTDISDNWKRVAFDIGFSQDPWAPFARPGHYNDADMLVVGQVGGWSGQLRPTRLTPDEQYTHISLWCLLSAPLLLGCDLEKLDDFTLGLLTNDEVLAVDQDSLGKQASCVSSNGTLRVFAKDLDDGAKAVGLFNLGDEPATAVANWSDLKFSGGQLVRDLWQQKDLGVFTNEFTATVAPHGVVLVKLSTATN